MKICVINTVCITRMTHDFADVYDHQGQGLYISYDMLFGSPIQFITMVYLAYLR